jgi:hypothetical protein
MCTRDCNRRAAWFALGEKRETLISASFAAESRLSGDRPPSDRDESDCTSSDVTSHRHEPR